MMSNHGRNKPISTEDVLILHPTKCPIGAILTAALSLPSRLGESSSDSVQTVAQGWQAVVMTMICVQDRLYVDVRMRCF